MEALTDAFLSNVEPPKTGRMEVADARCIGLCFRITAAGARSFSFRYRAKDGGGVSRITLGPYPALSLAKARSAADKLRAQVHTPDAVDPAAERREKRTGGQTFGNLANLYIDGYAKPRKASWQADARNLRLHILPKWAKRDYASIQRPHVVTLLEGIVAEGKDTLANRCQSLLSKIFNYAVDRGLRSDNPCFRMERLGQETVGERVLSDAELRLFWNGFACLSLPGHVTSVTSVTSRQTALGLWLALLTGCRIGEVAGLSRAELHDLDTPNGAHWILPAARVKTRKKVRRDHVIPLCPMARETICALLAMIEPHQEHLFPTQSKKRKGYMRSETFWQALDYFTGRLGQDESAAAKTWRADPPSPHDLRRTVETRLASLGVTQEVRDRVLNHTTAGTGAKHYNKYDYASEKREALMRWEGKLAAILSGATVIPLRAKGG